MSYDTNNPRRLMVVQVTINELMEEGRLEKAVVEIEFSIKDDVAKIHHYYENDYPRTILEQEIDEIVERIRKSITLKGIPCLSFEIYISGMFHELASKPSLEKCDKIKQDILTRWSHVIKG